MPSIAETYVTIFPETSKIAAGVKSAFRDVDSDAREAGRRWSREIKEGMGKTVVDLDADTAKAEEKIDKATRDRKPKIKPEADTKQAEEELAKASRDRRAQIKLDVDKSQLNQLSSLMQAGQLDQAKSLSALIRARQEFRSISENPFQGVNSLDFSNALLNLKSAEKSFANSMQGDVQSAIQSGVQSGGTAGVAGLTPALLGVGITMAAGIASALSGLAGLLPAGLLGAGGVVGTLVVGLDGVKEAWDAAGKAAASSGKDQASQAKAVTSAQRDLKSAVNDEARAQTDVANARKDALRQLQGLNSELRHGALDEAQAQLNLVKDQQELLTGTFSTPVDYQQAQLNVLKDQQDVQDAHQRSIDVQDKANTVRQQGVEGNPAVVAAEDRFAASLDRVAAAQQKMNDAFKPSTDMQAAADAMAKLSPNAQQFITTLQGMMPAFQQFKFGIQDALFANLGPQFQQLAQTYMPMLQGVMSQLATTMNQAFGQLAKFLEQPQTLAAMQEIFANIGSSFQIWSTSLQPFSEAFLKITQVGSTFLPKLAQMVVQVAQAFNQWAQSGQLGQWIQTGMTALQQLGGLLQQLLPMIADLAPIGIATMSGLQEVFAALAPSIGPLSTLFASLLTAITPVLGVIGQLISVVITSVAPALTTWLNALAPVIQQMAGLLQPVLQALAPVLQQTAGILAQAMVQGIKTLLPVLVPFVEQCGKFLIAILPLVPQLAQLAISVLPGFQQILATLLPIMTKWTQMFTDLTNIWVPGLGKQFEVLSSTATAQFAGLKTAVTTMWDVVKPILETMKTLIEAIAGPLAKIGDFYNTIFGSADSNALAKVNEARAAQGLPPLGPGGQAPGAGSPLPPRAVTQPGVTAPNGITPIGPPFTGLPPVSPLVPTGQTSGLTPGAVWTPGPGQAPLTWEVGKGWVPTAAPAGGTPAPAAPGGTPPVTTYMPPGVAPSGNVYNGPHTEDTHGLLTPNAANLKSQITQLFGVTDIGGYRSPDGYNEHSSGEALDIMVGANKSLGDQINQFLLKNANALGVQYDLWQQAQWNPDGSSSPMEDRGGATANHRDHVHVRVRPGAPGAATPLSVPSATAMPNMPTGQPTDPMYIALSPNIPAGQQKKSKDDSGGEQLGQDFLGGIGEIFGIDGSVFKDPTQFGLFKIFKAFMGLKLKDDKGSGSGSSDSGGGGGSGGGGIMDALSSFIPKPFGDLKIGSPQDAPGQFLPPGPGGSGGSAAMPTLPNPFAAPNDPSRVAGPGNGPPPVVNNFDMSGSNYGTTPQGVQDHIQQSQLPSIRTYDGPR